MNLLSDSFTGFIKQAISLVYFDYLLQLRVLLMMIEIVAGISAVGDVQEFCQNEAFSAKCSNNEVIIMETALYGRMRLGRCVKTDFGFVGCFTNVLKIAEGRCSGRQQCAIMVPDVQFDETRPCNEDLKSYLEVRYRCLPVITTPEHNCRVSPHPLTLDHTQGYLSSYITSTTMCGSPHAPWVIQGRLGQKINLTLYDFSTDGSEHENTEAVTCQKYATVSDGSTGRHLEVCGGRQRESHVYVSVSNKLEIRLSTRNKFHFLIKFEIIGCPDIKQPPNAYIKRKDNQVTIGCLTSTDKWHLLCKGTEWFGDTGNCTEKLVEEEQEQSTQSLVVFGDISFPVGISILIIILVALAIGGIILVFGLFLLRRKRKRSRRRHPKDAIPMTHASIMEAKTCGVPIRHHCAMASDYQASILKHSELRDNDYAYVWESPDHSVGTCCEGKKDTTIHALQPAPQNQNIVHYCATLPKDSAILHDPFSPSFSNNPPPGGARNALSTFQGTKHYFDIDPDVVPSATNPGIKTLDRFHRFPPCDDCERTRLNEKETAGRAASCATENNDISPESL